MKHYTLSVGQTIGHKPEHPERTAAKSVGSGMNFDIVYQVWPSREAMARTIRMQQRRERHSDDWRALMPLGDGEGYGMSSRGGKARHPLTVEGKTTNFNSPTYVYGEVGRQVVQFVLTTRKRRFASSDITITLSGGPHDWHQVLRYVEEWLWGLADDRSSAGFSTGIWEARHANPKLGAIVRKKWTRWYPDKPAGGKARSPRGRKEKLSELDRPRLRFNWGYHDGANDHKRGSPRILIEHGQGDLRHVSREFDEAYFDGYRYGLRDSRTGAYAGNSDPAWHEYILENPAALARDKKLYHDVHMQDYGRVSIPYREGGKRRAAPAGKQRHASAPGRSSRLGALVGSINRLTR